MNWDWMAQKAETMSVFAQLVFDPESIWSREKAVTEIALAHGYRPDGWGFWEPET